MYKRPAVCTTLRSEVTTIYRMIFAEEFVTLIRSLQHVDPSNPLNPSVILEAARELGGVAAPTTKTMCTLIELFERLDPGAEHRRRMLRKVYIISINAWTEDIYYDTIIKVLDSQSPHRRGELFRDMSEPRREEIVRRCTATDADWARTMDADVNACIVQLHEEYSKNVDVLFKMLGISPFDDAPIIQWGYETKVLQFHLFKSSLECINHAKYEIDTKHRWC